MVDTGANISILPENGSILKKIGHNFKPASINIQLADNAFSHINKKVKLYIRPEGAKEQPVATTFYVLNDVAKVVGHDALFGLNILKLFDLRIEIQKGKILVLHNKRVIGSETSCIASASPVVKMDHRIEDIYKDPELTSILKRYKSVFTDITREPMKTKPMRFLTVHNRPVFCKAKHYDNEQIQQMKKQIDELLAKGIIEPTYSGYSANTRIVPKKNGQGRLVVNYIPLNRVTLRDSYTLPHISDIINAVRGNKFFSSLDCQQGFHQILVDQRDRHKTAFSTPFGNFHYIRCPFGARNSPAQFQREMNTIFREGLYSKCVIYVDDILVVGRTKVEHDANLAWVLSKCQEYNVKLKLEKCKFAQQKIEYLGFAITSDTIEPLESKVDILSNSNAPRDKTELRSLIGKLNFYSRFIKEYSKHIEPLRELFRKNKDFQWKPYHQKALENLISSLKSVKPQRLVGILEHKTVELHIMGNSMEALLLTKDGDLMCRTSRLLTNAEANYSMVEKYLLALVSAIEKFRIWLHPEHVTVRLPTKELEKAMKLVNKPQRLENLLLRMPEGFDEFKFEIAGDLPTLRKDNKRLKGHVPQEIYYIDGACKHNGKEDCVATWAVCSEFDRDLELTGYVLEHPSNNTGEVTAAIKACEYAKKLGQDEITIVTDSDYLHSAVTKRICVWQTKEWKDHKGKPVVNADLFKRLLYAKDGLKIEWIHVNSHNKTATDIHHVGNNRADSLARSLISKQVARLCAIATYPRDIQAGSEEVQELIAWIERVKPSNYEVINGTVFYIDKKLDEEDCRRVYVPKAARTYLLNLAHDDPLHGGHVGIRKTYGRLMRFWWPRIYKEIEEYVKSCDVCQKFKNPKGPPVGYLHSVPVSEIFEHLHIDIMGPVKRTYRGNAYIITATDAFSKWAFARAVQQTTTDVIIDFVKEAIVSIHGTPKVIRSDQGPQFTSHQWKDFLKEIGAKHSVTCPYSPQANGIDERVNGTLTRILRTNVDEHQEDWDLNLIWAVRVYNNTVHESIGFSPYQVLHGRDPRTPLREINRDKSLNPHTISFEDIRKQVKDNNEAAQIQQTKNYNSKHQQFPFKAGQFVYIRNHTVPQHLSKKFYPSWHGPVIITNLLGDDEDNPTAVKVYDFKLNIWKTVSVRDIKARKNRDPELCDTELAEETKEQENSCESESQFYFDEPNFAHCNQQEQSRPPDILIEPVSTPSDATQTVAHRNNVHNPVTEQATDVDLITFDVIENNEDGQPITSSPLPSPDRLVTFDDEVQVREISRNDDNQYSDQDTTQDTTLTNNTTQLENPAIVTRRSQRIQSNSQPEKEKQASPYLMDFIIDNVNQDPTYIPPKSSIPVLTRPTQAKNSEQIQNVQIESPDNRAEASTNPVTNPKQVIANDYNLRPRPEKSYAYKPKRKTTSKRVKVQAPKRHIIESDVSMDTSFKSAHTGDTPAKPSNADTDTNRSTTNTVDETTFVIERDAPKNNFLAAIRSLFG